VSYQPPFTITTEIIDLISAVSEQVGFVQRDFLDVRRSFAKKIASKRLLAHYRLKAAALGSGFASCIGQHHEH